jgi:hypothetical protein
MTIATSEGMAPILAQLAPVPMAPALLRMTRGNRIMKWLIAVTLCALLPAVAQGQAVTRSTPQQGSEPNYGTAPDQGTGPGGQEIREGNADGDMPSASAGRLMADPVERRVLGLPVTAVLLIAAVILGLLALAGFVVPGARRRRQARGGGTYGP